MNHLLIGSLLIFTLNAEKCNQESSAAEPANEQAQERRAQDPVPVDELPAEQDMDRLLGRKWYILTMNEVDLVLPDGAERPWLELEAEQLQGFGGCNNLMGSYNHDGNTLFFSEVGSTKKYCQEIQAVERSILEMLGEVNAYHIEDDGTLYLLQGVRQLATLKTAEE